MKNNASTYSECFSIQCIFLRKIKKMWARKGASKLLLDHIAFHLLKITILKYLEEERNEMLERYDILNNVLTDHSISLAW